jgi:hypothetical protein
VVAVEVVAARVEGKQVNPVVPFTEVPVQAIPGTAVVAVVAVAANLVVQVELFQAVITVRIRVQTAQI